MKILFAISIFATSFVVDVSKSHADHFFSDPCMRVDDNCNSKQEDAHHNFLHYMEGRIDRGLWFDDNSYCEDTSTLARNRRKLGFEVKQLAASELLVTAVGGVAAAFGLELSFDQEFAIAIGFDDFVDKQQKEGNC